MAKKIGNKAGRFGAVVIPLGRDWKGQGHIAHIFDGDSGYLCRQCPLFVQAGRVVSWCQVTVFDGVKTAAYHVLQVVKRLRTVDGQGHKVGRVMVLPEINQIRAKWVVPGVLEGAQITDCKLTEGVCRVGDGLLHRVQATSVFLLPGAELRINRISFLIYQCGRKQRGGELLGKSVQCRLQKLSLNVKEIIGVLEGGKGVVTAAMTFYELLILARLRVSLSAKKQHVFQKMSESFTVFRIVSTTNGYVHGRRSFICA